MDFNLSIDLVLVGAAFFFYFYRKNKTPFLGSPAQCFYDIMREKPILLFMICFISLASHCYMYQVRAANCCSTQNWIDSNRTFTFDLWTNMRVLFDFSFVLQNIRWIAFSLTRDLSKRLHCSLFIILPSQTVFVFYFFYLNVISL